MSKNNYNLDDLRKEIDVIDDNIVKLLVSRFDVVKNVAEYKKEHNLDVLQQSREDEVLRNINKKIGESEDYIKYILHIYRNILDASKLSQHKINSQNKSAELENLILNSYKNYTVSDDEDLKTAVVGCQGIEGAYSGKAADILFKKNKKIFFENFSDVFNAVKNNVIDIGVIPLENSSAGEVKTIYNLLQNSDFYINAGIELSVSHCLLTKNSIDAPVITDITDITDVYSHEQGLLQCKEFFDKNPHIKKHICQNTAVAAKLVSESNLKNIAAISSEDCAEKYKLNVILRDLQDFKNNFTRFICISKSLKIYKNSDKISIILKLPNTFGSLNRLLSKFAMYEVNLSKIESHYIPGSNFEFMFYIDADGCVYNSNIKDLLCIIKNEMEYFQFLGNYRYVK